MMTLHRANGGARALLGMLMVAGAGLPASGCKGSAAAPPSSDAGAAFDASINAPSSDAGKEAASATAGEKPAAPAAAVGAATAGVGATAPTGEAVLETANSTSFPIGFFG